MVPSPTGGFSERRTMLADQHDDDLKDIWAAHAAGRLTDDEAQAAAEAVQARRGRRQGNDTGEPPRPPNAMRL